MKLYYENKMGKLYLGDIKDFKSDKLKESCSLVITDPPYAKEYNYLWDIIGEKSSILLKDGGSLITLLGHTQLPYAIESLNKYLRYWWICGLKNNPYNKRIFGKKVYAHFKPALWYLKGKRGDSKYPIDFISTKYGDWDKSKHIQAQPVVWFEHYIEKLTQENDLVIDFFAGSGSSIRAAEKLNRRWMAIEIDENNCKIIKGKLTNGRDTNDRNTR